MLNPIMGHLTEKEIEILVVIVDKQISILDKDSRTDIRMSLDMDKFNFNNYIKKLVTKKVFQQVDKNTLKVNPNILHILKHDSVNLYFV
jgi:glutaredoxin 2